MKSTVFTILFVLLSTLVFSQDFSYKVSDDIKWEKIAEIDFSAEFEDFQIENKSLAAPEPHSDVQALKKELDAKRSRKNTKLHKTLVISSSGKVVNPNVVDDFNGMPRGGGGVPNDNNMAISNDGIVVSVINSTVTMMDDTGGVLMYRTLSSLVRGELTGLNRTFDPKINYDPLNDRFILVFLQGSTSADTRIVTGFSQSNDPTKLWNFYAVDGNPFNEKTWSDYPIIGMNEEDFFITVNILGDGESWQEGFRQSVIWQINKESGYTDQDTLTSRLFHDLKYKNKSIWSMCIVPQGDWASDRGEYNDARMHFLSVRPDARSNDTLFVQSIYGTVANGNSGYDLHTRTTSIPYGVPPSAFQSQVGYRLQTNDTRVLGAFEQDGVIQYVQSTVIPKTGMPGIFHGVFDLNNREQVKANYISSDSFEYAYPSIAYIGDKNRNRASAITFSHSSEYEFPGTSVVFYNGLEGLGEAYSEVVKVKTGEGLINTFLADSIERWGDYTGIQRKYNEQGIAWLCGSYGRANNTVGTWIGKIDLDVNITPADPLDNVILFPNPVQSEVNLVMESNNDAIYKFNIYDMAGKLVVELGEYQMFAGLNTVRLNLDDMRLGALRPGMYLFQVETLSGDVLNNQKFTLTGGR